MPTPWNVSFTYSSVLLPSLSIIQERQPSLCFDSSAAKHLWGGGDLGLLQMISIFQLPSQTCRQGLQINNSDCGQIHTKLFFRSQVAANSPTIKEISPWTWMTQLLLVGMIHVWALSFLCSYFLCPLHCHLVPPRCLLGNRQPRYGHILFQR